MHCLLPFSLLFLILSLDYKLGSASTLLTRSVFDFGDSVWSTKLALLPNRCLQLCLTSNRCKNGSSSLLISLLCSSDIQLNPGPLPTPSAAHICFLCPGKLDGRSRPIACDSCSHLTHAKCTSLSAFEKLQRREGQHVPWYCSPNCQPPLVFPDFPNLSQTVSWSELPCVSPDISVAANCVDDNIASAPFPAPSRNAPVFASANVNSLLSKFPFIEALLDSSGFAAFAVQETKLNSSIMSSDNEL